ncbi:4a-hydroxytetrahydrobiopterin dehydratase [Mycolicibacterium conceptionense]|jgi:4a-hydroxytetrahydrobiopterin dehydratase|uniref:Putative pterin-4-alpha-carbinolamine dehydratase n=2 Tax=Mycolicibacterium TaxID=1866885 RepID=A0ABR5FSN9_9MYCO|nr:MULTISPECIES: VOC family protein [Mycolicibacterium]KLI05982.1 4a-hydroxytetrahydrobiopterin dehydratase [Mycolicibacterium senegalense]KLO50949.1 4a-hydroxytetrahydrobiopterin dehydratase [Mycolicibacterium senegalense]KMV17916.1 4a-hydroxytetrahydrobiopterin dehydratase [Mycolicibacterium conceptionense]OBK07576.1 4a-hydroxytetrahydrobiopterin dehydratase [Mycolicibacterium conceptionense]OMB78525.1 4a-hydroxytetrahydrobiopterin dehydratase [Mycolicibacterium conceptionense]
MPLNRREISEAVGPLGWRLVLGAVYTEVLAPSMADAVAAASHAVHAAGRDASGHLSIDIRADRAVLRLRTQDAHSVTERDLALAREVSGVLAARGFEQSAGAGAIQAMEIAIDALDIGAVRPFWKAVTGYVDEPGNEDLNAGLVDPFGRGPAIWFQQMDAPRPQRNRIHLDIDVTHDAAQARVDAAMAAGGILLSDRVAPRFWVLADVEGNEACICTWQGRD